MDDEESCLVASRPLTSLVANGFYLLTQLLPVHLQLQYLMISTHTPSPANV
jgi:hypothetical protein